MNGARPGRVMMHRCHDECHELCLPAECALEAAMKHRNAGAHRRCCGLLGGNIAMTRTSPRPRSSRLVGVGTMKSGGKGAIPAVAEAVHWNAPPQCAR